MDPTHQPPQRTVLLVDDDPENVGFMARTFRSDYKLLTAGSGAEAMDLLLVNMSDA